jgi:hypothetical protein
MGGRGGSSGAAKASASGAASNWRFGFEIEKAAARGLADDYSLRLVISPPPWSFH